MVTFVCSSGAARSLASITARHYGLKKFAAPTAGNAGGALVAYAALAGIEAHIFMPKDTPNANQVECRVRRTRLPDRAIRN